MNKSWKRFDQLVSTPCFPKSARKDPRRNGGASRALTQLFQKSPNQSLCKSLQNRSLPESDLEIEDASDEENTVPPSNQQDRDYTIEPCSAPSLEPKDLVERLESDIEDVSGDEAEVISESSSSSSSDSDCESIRCKRAKRRVGTLKYAKSPAGSRRPRITDDTLLVVSAVPRAATLEKSSAWMKMGTVKSTTTTTPVAKKRWIQLDESFKVKSPTTTAEKKSPRWKELEKSFRASPEAEIESLESTPDNIVAAAVVRTDVLPERVGYFYEPGKDGPMKMRKGCPLSRLQAVLFEKASRQTFWLHERQMGLVVGKRPVKVESITRIFGRVAISYKEADRDEPSLQVEHVVYIDPVEKQLKMLGLGSLIEIEYDLEPHKLRRDRVVHLGVCKIRVVN